MMIISCNWAICKALVIPMLDRESSTDKNVPAVTMDLSAAAVTTTITYKFILLDAIVQLVFFVPFQHGRQLRINEIRGKGKKPIYLNEVYSCALALHLRILPGCNPLALCNTTG